MGVRHANRLLEPGFGQDQVHRSREGGLDKLKGKKIANIYHNSAYGKETIPMLEVLAKKYGFEVHTSPVDQPGRRSRRRRG